MTAKYLKPDGTWHLTQAEVEHINTLNEQIERLTADRDMAREWVAAQMIAHGIATGHGDTVQDLVATLLHEVIRGQRALALLRKAREPLAHWIHHDEGLFGLPRAEDVNLLAEIDALLEDR